MTACPRTPAAVAPLLIHIRHGFSSACDNLRLRVEAGAEGWTAEVRDQQDGRTLYNARRCSLEAAKVATAEFALFRVPGRGRQTPERLARELFWQEYW
jgi:hypothetical protein